MNNPKVDSTARGVCAGLVATCSLAAVLIVTRAVGVMSHIDLVAILAHALGSHSLAVGWSAHFFVGTLLWGPLFAWADRRSRYTHWVNGLAFGSVVWLGVMLVIMPLAGAGLFGLALGVATPTLTLFLHWVYGAVLGIVYGALKPGMWTIGPGHRLRHA